MTFSIRAILALTAFIAVLVGLLFVFPDLVATIGLMILNPLISAAMLTSAIYGRHGWRAFCIGAAGPTMFMACFHTWLVGIVGMDTTSADLSYYFEEMGEMALVLQGPNRPHADDWIDRRANRRVRALDVSTDVLTTAPFRPRSRDVILRD